MDTLPPMYCRRETQSLLFFFSLKQCGNLSRHDLGSGDCQIRRRWLPPNLNRQPFILKEVLDERDVPIALDQIPKHRQN